MVVEVIWLIIVYCIAIIFFSFLVNTFCEDSFLYKIATYTVSAIAMLSVIAIIAKSFIV